MDITVVGGGLSGLFAALCLRRQVPDSRVTVLERRADLDAPETHGYHVALSLCPRGLRALERAGVRIAEGAPMTGVQGAEYESPCTVVSRFALWTQLRAAAEAAGVEVRLGAPVTASPLAAGGEEIRADLVVAADGARSVMRAHALRELATALRGPADDDGGGFLESGAADVLVERHFLTYRSLGVVRDGGAQLRVWPGRSGRGFALGLPLPDGSGASAVAAYGDAADVEVPGLEPQPQQGAGKATMTSVVPQRLAAGNVVLVGDAAHGMLPFLGQGLNSSLWEIDLLASAVAAGRHDIPAALREHSDRLQPGLRRLVLASRAQAAALLQLRPGAAVPAPGRFFSLAAETDMDYAAAYVDAGSRVLRADWARVGDAVERGQVLATVRAVKTETVVRAERSGVVSAVEEGAQGVPSFTVSGPASADEQPEAALDGAELQRRLVTRAVGRFVSVRALTTSTMDDARREAEAGAPHGAVFLAEAMTAGRGRGGRSWASVSGRNLYVTFVLRRVASLPALHFAAAVATAEACRAGGAAAAELKWPNDVVAGAAKLSGLLVDAEGPELALLGIGINVCAVPEAVAGVAASLEDVAGRPVARELVLAHLCNRLEALLAEPVAALRERYAALCGTAGVVAVLDKASGRERLRGTVVGVQPDGALRVARAGDGAEVDVTSAEASVRALRAVYSGPGASPPGAVLAALGGGRAVASVAALDGADVLVVPGGAETRFDLDEARVRAFVEAGGTYVGICAGAYFASARMEFDVGGPLEERGARLLGLFPGVARGPEFPGFSYNDRGGVRVVGLRFEGRTVQAHFNGGCSFHDLPASGEVAVLATYEDTGAPAIIEVRVGQGRAILSGVHPEEEPVGEWFWGLLS